MKPGNRASGRSILRPRTEPRSLPPIFLLRRSVEFCENDRASVGGSNRQDPCLFTDEGIAVAALAKKPRLLCLQRHFSLAQRLRPSASKTAPERFARRHDLPLPQS